MQRETPILIAGCGYIGRALATSLLRKGHSHVRAWTRRGVWNPSDEEALPSQAPCPLQAIDLLHCEDTELEHALQVAGHGSSGAGALVLSYAAGRSSDSQARSNLYVQSPQRIFPKLARGSRVIALSSTSALPDLDAQLDESCTLAPQSARGQLQRQAEDTLWRLANDHGLDLVILRLAGLYGPGRALTRLYGRTSEEPRPGDGHVATNLVHRDDVVTAIEAALALPAPVHRLVHVCGDDHPSRRTMIDWAHQELGQPPPTWSLSKGQGVPRGKRVCNARLLAPVQQGGLGCVLSHPRHGPAHPGSPHNDEF